MTERRMIDSAELSEVDNLLSALSLGAEAAAGAEGSEVSLGRRAASAREDHDSLPAGRSEAISRQQRETEGALNEIFSSLSLGAPSNANAESGVTTNIGSPITGPLSAVSSPTESVLCSERPVSYTHLTLPTKRRV